MKLFFRVSCPYCGAAVSGQCEDYVVDTFFDEREMGSETEYKIKCDEYDCPECGKPLSLNGSIWEYPEGVENLNDVVAVPIDGVDDDLDDKSDD